ncbi:MAG: hypothetical protein ACUVUQ_09970 [Thermodesulfovibrionales bacterium]
MIDVRSEKGSNNKIKDIVKKVIMFAGAITRTLVGISAIVMISFSLKKKKK